MLSRWLTALLMLIAGTGTLWADIPGPGPRPVRPLDDLPPPPLDPKDWPASANKKTPVRLTVSYDSSATSAKLVLPQPPAQPPRVVSAMPATVVGLTFAASLSAAGVWLARRRGAKYLLLVPLLLVAFVGLAVHAQPISSRTTIETGKVRLTRGDGAEVQLILPKRSK